MVDPYLAIKGLTGLAKSLGFNITPSSTGPYIYTGLDTFLKLDTEINEGWGSDEEYNTYYFDLDTPQGIGDCAALLTRLAEHQPETV